MLNLNEIKVKVLPAGPPEVMLYGNMPVLDAKADSTDEKVRVACAEIGYALDKLKDDASVPVRLAVARQGYFSEQFIQDSSPLVRRIAEEVKKYGRVN